MSEEPPASSVPPPTEDRAPAPAFARLFGTRAYFRLWLAQVASSTGDWLGLLAILAIASRISNSGAAVSLVMVARVVPGFFLGTIGGVIIDRLDRRKVMVVCDLGRASLLLLLPFVENLLGLVLISFGLEILSLLWGPAKDASVPNLVGRDKLTSANTLTLVASFGTFPFASIIFVLLAALAGWLGDFDALSGLRLDQEVLALFVDACTFIVSAIIVWRLPIPHDRDAREERGHWTQTFRDIQRRSRLHRHAPESPRRDRRARDRVDRRGGDDPARTRVRSPGPGRRQCHVRCAGDRARLRRGGRGCRAARAPDGGSDASWSSSSR